ncbi:MAG: 1-(5-phosphoribosyl)-5-((5-phosphoribosylamino)methylideneamino)imidazole-4-carboxamide isomerase, partial [Lachnospiraceae bacterium]|nr:1-(5-phosphoribosyl)-5-((5-phosphoribosylamino)methylideneamino)imidazole-4-carboxamide isomerase [Lachnospiraceae bacterium]
DDLVELKKAGLYGAILGKAMYTGNIDLREALKV